MFSIYRSVKPTTTISSYLAKRPFTEKSYDGSQEKELQEGVDRLVKHVCDDVSDESISDVGSPYVDGKLFFGEEGCPIVWTAQSISLKDVLRFMRSKGAIITPYSVYACYEE